MLEPIARLAAATLVACWALIAALPAARAAGQDTIEIVTRTGVHAFAVELATNTAERAVGLMYRKELPEGRGRPIYLPFCGADRRGGLLEFASRQTDFLHLAASQFWALLLEAVEK